MAKIVITKKIESKYMTGIEIRALDGSKDEEDCFSQKVHIRLLSCGANRALMISMAIRKIIKQFFGSDFLYDWR